MRTIDADRLQKTIAIIQADNDCPPSPYPEYGTMCFYEISDMVDDEPTVDPVHAAGGCYCRECAMFKNYTKVNLDFGICKQHNSEVDKDAFCSYGVRKDGEKHD